MIHPTAIISENSTLGKNVKVGAYSIIYDNVILGDNVVIAPHCIIGEPLFTSYNDVGYENPETRVGRSSIIRSGSIIYAGCEMAEEFQTGHKVVIREYSKFGKRSIFGTLSQSDGYVEVGEYSRIHNNVFLAQKTKVGNYVWIFPMVTTVDAHYPPCRDCAGGPEIKDKAIIGAKAFILPRLIIGEEAIVASNSVVTKNVDARTLVKGHPARDVCNIEDIVCKYNKDCRPYPWDINIVKQRYDD
jgi:UDP-3-O-[3-hydroxymyristoyl] glucosamine N-acyltransferase